MNKKGFTLIELLAVIVILGVILVIAIPSISAAILNSRKNSFVATANEFVDGARLMALNDSSILPSTGSTDIPITNIKLEKGSSTKSPFGKTYTPDSKVQITYDEDNNDYIYAICLIDDGGNRICGEDETPIDIKTVSKDTVIIGGSIPEPEPDTTYYPDGTVVYFNPVSGEKCDAASAVSTTGTKTGCMKWYAFLDSETGATTINLLLDHDTTGKTVGWISNHYNARGGPDPSLLNQLKTDTDGWTGVPLRTDSYTLNIPFPIVNYTINYSECRARIISAFEVAEILNVASFNVSNNYINISNTYSWLIDNTASCNQSNCHADANSNGYWTSTVGTTYSGTTYYGYPYFVWYVPSNLSVQWASNASGIRPVITIPKLMIK